MIKIAGFDWDEGNRGKCRKHGISLREIEEVFAELTQVAPDLKHSDREPRQLTIGRTAAGRYVFVVFTMRGAEIDRYDPQGS